MTDRTTIASWRPHSASRASPIALNPHAAPTVAISAIDAHGVDNVPSASVAFDFIQNMDYELEEEVPVLTRKEYRQFVHDYNRHVRRLQAIARATTPVALPVVLYDPPTFTRESAQANIQALARLLYPSLN